MEEKAAEYAGELAALEGLVADLGPLAGLLPERAAPEQAFNLFELLKPVVAGRRSLPVLDLVAGPPGEPRRRGLFP